MFRRINSSRLKWLILLLAVSGIFFSGCEKSDKKAEAEQLISKAEQSNDKELADFQNELLDIAFQTASSISITPHIKDRSKAQQRIIETYLELDQPAETGKLLNEIKNWRRGLCFGQLALYYAERGDEGLANKNLSIAEEIASKDFRQQWRKDRIKVKIAETYAVLGQDDRAAEFGDDVVESETGKLAITNAKTADPNTFYKHAEALDKLVALQGFETTRNALFGYAELFKRFYENEEFRSKAEKRIKTSWKKLPIPIRLDLMMHLAEFAIDKNDKIKSLQLVNESQSMLDNNNWPIDKLIPTSAELSKLRFASGDAEKAKATSDELFEKFNSNKEYIWDIYRTEAILPLAEVYGIMGETKKALEVYKLAVEEGTKNPNSRPRAEDISAILCSMALHAVEPDAELWSRIKQISNGLRQQ